MQKTINRPEPTDDKCKVCNKGKLEISVTLAAYDGSLSITVRCLGCGCVLNFGQDYHTITTELLDTWCGRFNARYAGDIDGA